jgi:hypothetical protein
MRGRVRQVPLEPEPDSRLDELMDTEQQGQRRKREMAVLLSSAPKGVDADGADHGSSDEISLRREAHWA